MMICSLLLPATFATDAMPSKPLFAGPAFADGPYNSVLGALGSGDKALVSQEGVLTRLYKSVGAQGMGRGNELIGEALRLTRTDNGAALLDVQVEYDEASRSIPTLLATRTYADGIILEVRAVQVDTGWEIGNAANDGGFVLNVTIRNTSGRTVGVQVAAAVDWLANLTSSTSASVNGSSSLTAPDGKAILCGSSDDWMPVVAPPAGRVSADGFRPGRQTSPGSSPSSTGMWANTWALSENYPGQHGHVGRPVGSGTLRYIFADLPNSSKIYLAVAPALSSAKSGMPVEAGPNASFVSGGNGTDVFYLATETDSSGRLQVATGAVPSAPKGWHQNSGVSLSGVWVYARKDPRKSMVVSVAEQSSNRLVHVCDPQSGLDSKNGQCLHVRPCDKTSLTQQFERFPCSHWNRETDGMGDEIPLPADAECLSHKVTSGQRHWLNAELWGAATCEAENGPLISYGSFVWPVFGGSVCGRNQFFTFSGKNNENTGTIRNNISTHCLSYDSKSGFGSLAECVDAAVAQQWHFPVLGKTGPIQLMKENRLSNMCLDAVAPPPAPRPGSVFPGRPADAGELLAFVDAGSDDDLPADNPTLQLKAKLEPTSVRSAMLYMPAGNSSLQHPGSDACATHDSASLWSATVATWKSRQTKWGSIKIPDAKLTRAVEIAQQTLLMMTETQRDGLRGLKSPVHYYGSDPYDTFRITRALMRWGRGDVSEAILTRQLGRRCAQGHGTWEMWEIDGKNDCGRNNVTPLFIVQGLASNALTDQWRFMPAGSAAAADWLEKVWPALDGTANATQAQRKLCGQGCAGLLPTSGGDGGLPSGHIYVQEAGALFGVADAITVAKAVGDAEAEARHTAVFNEFRAALLRNVTANSVRVSVDYPLVVGMYPGFTPGNAEGCCAWGGVDIIYPFPLVNFSSPSAVSSMKFWSSPDRTDKFGLHLKLGYSQKVWAYLSADLGHIHIQQGNHSGAMRVLQAMVDNASPTVGTYEEFETGPWHSSEGVAKQSWGGIPDMWFTSEVLNLLRDALVHEDEEEGSLRLFHGAPDRWRRGDALSIRAMPTSFGVILSVAADWGILRSKFTIQFQAFTWPSSNHGQVNRTDKDGETRGRVQVARPGRIFLHSGSCAEIISVQGIYSSATQLETPIGASPLQVSFPVNAHCEESTHEVVELALQHATNDGREALVVELMVAH